MPTISIPTSVHIAENQNQRKQTEADFKTSLQKNMNKNEIGHKSIISLASNASNT